MVKKRLGARRLSAAVRAQTILAASRRVVIYLTAEPDCRSGPAAGFGTGCAALSQVAGLVTRDRVPHLVLAPGETLPAGALTVRCEGPAELGTLVFTARARRPVLAGGATLAPLRLEHVRVMPGGGGRVRPVPLGLFEAAEPDLWSVHRAGLMEHLEMHHQAELRALTGGPAGGAAVAVRDVAPEGMVLTRLSLDGVSEHVFPFDPPMHDPAAFGPWLRAAATV